MDSTTNEVRINQWKKIIAQCQARPEGQTTKQWLEENGVKNRAYYYWLRKIRSLAYEQAVSTAAAENLPAASPQTQPPVSFAEVPYNVGAEEPNDTLFHPAAVIKAGAMSVAFSNNVSNELLSGIIREVLGNA